MTYGLNYELIKSATKGDVEAINIIMKIYEPYINKLSTKRLFDKSENEYMGIDVDLHDRLKRKLLKVIVNYKTF